MTNNPTQTSKVPEKAKSTLRENTEVLVIALILALFIRTFIIQAFKIPSGSMKDTLLIGDHLLVSKFKYGMHIPNEIPFSRYKLFDDYTLFQRTPERNDIIVFKYPKNEKRDFIKRVIGLPGETIEISGQQVYINNKLLDEPFTKHTEPPSVFPNPRDNFGPIRIPEGHVFVMGDNRENSADSRFWGFLDIRKIRGKALMIYWSWSTEDSWVRFDRFGDIIR